jgi:hypothetical protein
VDAYKNPEVALAIEQDVCVWAEKSSSSAGTWLAKKHDTRFGESGHLAEKLRSWLFPDADVHCAHWEFLRQEGKLRVAGSRLLHVLLALL